MSVPTVEHPKILIAEDEIVVALDLEQSLTGLGYDVVGVADTGRGAVRLVNEVRPHLVLMDIRLKGQMDGIEAAEEIRRRSQVPVVFVTAFTDRKSVV